MKIPSVLFLHFAFLGVFNGCLSSNPDSVIVESPEDNAEKNAKIQIEQIKEKSVMSADLPRVRRKNSDSILIQSLLNTTKEFVKIRQEENEQKPFTSLNQPCVQSEKPDSVMIKNTEDNTRKMAKIQMDDNEQKVFITFDQPRELIVRYMQPVNIGSENLWREVHRQKVDRSQNSNERTARIQMEEIEQKALTSSDELSAHTENPDSIMIQNPVRSTGKMGKVQMEDSEQRVFISFDGPDSFIVAYMRPVAIGSETVWREVHRERIDKTRPFTPVPDIMRTPRPKPWDIDWTTERSITVDTRRTTPNYNVPQTPPNRGKGINNNRENARTVKPFPTTETEDVLIGDEESKTVVTRSPGTISPESNLFAGIVNDFAFKLVETLDLESNFVISPLSIFIALSMCYLGSNGQTKSQMEQVFGINDKLVNEEFFHQGIKDLLSSVMGGSPGYELLIANGMFFPKNYAIEPEFKERIKEYYNAELKEMDFGSPQLTLQLINRWVSQNTKNTITSIINSPPPIMTRLMLLNAVYFKGMWKMQFPPQLTHKTNFQTLEGNNKEIEIMRMFDATFPLFRSDDHLHSFIKLPYEGDQLSMIIALPYSARSKPLPSIRDKILRQVQDAMKDTNLGKVEIPKFHLEYRKSLIRPLQELGMTNIFDRNNVDFSKIRKENDVHVTAIMHKAVVEVNEVGTTASASTSDSFTPLIYRKNVNFVADHPFAFYIVHEPTGLVLFYGKVFDFDTEEVVAIDRRQKGNSRPRINSERRG